MVPELKHALRLLGLLPKEVNPLKKKELQDKLNELLYYTVSHDVDHLKKRNDCVQYIKETIQNKAQHTRSRAQPSYTVTRPIAVSPHRNVQYIQNNITLNGYCPYTNTYSQPPVIPPMKIDMNLRYSNDPFYTVLDEAPILPPTVVRSTIEVFNVEDRPNCSVVVRCFAQDQLNEKYPKHSWPSGFYVELNQRFCETIHKAKKDIKTKIKDSYGDITKDVRVGRNTIKLNYSSKILYLMVIQYMRRVSVDELVDHIKKKRLSKEDSIQMIKSQFVDHDDEVAEVKKKFSLIDPLMCTRMSIPVRSTYCKHCDCFDLNTYLQLNNRIRTWMCPVCANEAPWDTLIVDEYFVEILENMTSETPEVEILPDGSWKLIGAELKTRNKDGPNVYCIEEDEENDFYGFNSDSLYTPSDSLMSHSLPPPPFMNMGHDDHFIDLDSD